MTRTVRVDIDGLNLILGGGIPVLKRHPDFAGESAALLVRGPPGVGKTVLGVQLAGSLARNLDAGVVHDVAYACVELLPSELEAQHAGIKRPEVKERVLVAPFVARPRAVDECRIFAEMLDIGTDGEEVDKLGEALDRVLAAIRERGGDPKVLVIDSLSDGYRLGSLAPRALADALCKMAAQQGLVLIMLEETVSHQPSAWSFACDLVIELSLTAVVEGGVLERRMTIPKNRLGPCEPGPHRVDVLSGWGVQVIPVATAAYMLAEEFNFRGGFSTYAIAELRRPVDHDAWDAAHRVDLLTRILLADDKNKGAITEALELLRIWLIHHGDAHPMWARFKLRRILCLQQQGNRAQVALNELDVLMVSNASSPALHCLRGNLLGYLGNYPAAIAEFDNAIGLSERWPEPQLEKIEKLVLSGQYKDAIADASDCLEHPWNNRRAKVILKANRLVAMALRDAAYFGSPEYYQERNRDRSD